MPIKSYSQQFDEEIKFGVELEIIVPIESYSNLASQLSGLTGLDVRSSFAYNNQSSDHGTHWTIKPDASVSPRRRSGIMTGCEIVSPPMCGSAGLERVKVMTRALKEIGARVNGSCGVHVHHDVHGFFSDQTRRVYGVSRKMRKIIDFYAEYEGALDWLVPASRRGDNNPYCHSIRTAAARLGDDWFNPAGNADMNSTLGYHTHGRYTKMNVCSWRSHGTIEFRHFGGSLNPIKICSWVWLTQRFAARAMTMRQISKDRRKSFDDLLEVLRLKGAERERLDDATKKQIRRITKRARKMMRQEGQTSSECMQMRV